MEENHIEYYSIKPDNNTSLEDVLSELLSNIRSSCLCDAGTIYLKNAETLQFHIYQNDTMSAHSKTVLEEIFKPIYLNIVEDSDLLAVRALTQSKIICIDDIYKSEENDFKGTKEIDEKVGYKSHSFLTIPLRNSLTHETIGVLQLINKLDSDGQIIAFSKADRKRVEQLANFAAMVILHTYEYLKNLSNVNVTLHEENKKLTQKLEQKMKMAAMGEMIDAVAHQWAQPLGIIGSKIAKIELNCGFDAPVNKEYLQESLLDMKQQVAHLQKTLYDFRNFFKNNEMIRVQSFEKILKDTLILVHDELEAYDITYNISIEENAEFLGHDTELKNVLLNLINNARDAFVSNGIEKRHLDFNVMKKKTSVILEVTDNAGGIDASIIEKVFKANFTTKNEGSGIGLYMSKQIVEKHHGKLQVSSQQNTTTFRIEMTTV